MAEAKLLVQLHNLSVLPNGDRRLYGQQGTRFNKADLYSDWRERSMILSPEGVRLMLLCRGVRHVYHVHCFYLRGKLLLTPGIWVVNLFVIAITGRSFPLMFGVEPACLKTQQLLLV